MTTLNGYLTNPEFLNFLNSTKKNRRVLIQYRFLHDQYERIDQLLISMRSQRLKRVIGRYAKLKTQKNLVDTYPKLLLEEQRILGQALKEMEENWLKPKVEAFFIDRRFKKNLPVPFHLALHSHIRLQRPKWWQRFSIWKLLPCIPHQEKIRSPENFSSPIDEEPKKSKKSIISKEIDCAYSISIGQISSTNQDPNLFSKLLKEKLEIVQQLRIEVQENRKTIKSVSQLNASL